MRPEELRARFQHEGETPDQTADRLRLQLGKSMVELCMYHAARRVEQGESLSVGVLDGIGDVQYTALAVLERIFEDVDAPGAAGLLKTAVDRMLAEWLREVRTQAVGGESAPAQAPAQEPEPPLETKQEETP